MKDLKNSLRPLNSSMMVGQSSTVKVLHEMRKRGSIDHAMLFWGYSGCGKTTSARIMASYLNCENPQDGEPCNECSNCKALRLGNFSDYYELDAASNSGKEDIEKLLEGVSYAPVFGRAKVYVIDECHRLSNSAWDALLKVIEEPPAHVYFMLCTTELDKVPKTIQTRAKAYSFSKVSEEDMFAYLSTLNKELEKGYTDEALKLLCEISDGSMRELVNNFEHVSTPFASGEEITEQDVRKYLAIIGPETILGFVLNVANGDVLESYLALDEQEKMGVSADAFIKAVHNALSTCLSAKFGKVANVSNTYSEVLKGVDSISLERLVGLADSFNECYANLNERNYASLRVRVAKLCLLEENTTSIGSLKAEIERLKAELKSGVIPVTTQQVVEQLAVEECEQDEYIPSEPTDEYVSEPVGESVDDEELAYYASMSESVTEEDMYSPFEDDCTQPANETEVSVSSDEEDEDGEMSLEDMLSGQFEVAREEAAKKDKPFAPAEDFVGDDEDNPFSNPINLGGYAGGIVFNSASAANIVVGSQSKAKQARSKIAELRGEDKLFDVIIGECSAMVESDDALIIKTPFEPVKRVVEAYLNRDRIEDVVVEQCPNMDL